MNGIEISIIFLMITFLGSLIFATKKKSANTFGFFINLEVEYILIGIIFYFITDKLNKISINGIYPYMAIILVFMGVLIGSQFSVKLLKNVNKKLYLSVFIIFYSVQLLFWVLFKLCNFEMPYLLATMLNTSLPYSIQLFGKLFRVKQDKIFNILLITSIYPAYSITNYGLYIGIKYFSFKNLLIGGMIALLFSIIVSIYSKVNNKKDINTVSIIMLILLAGLALFFKISPLILGFLSGLLLSNFHYGDIFISNYGSFDRFFYIFCFIFIGIFIPLGFPPPISYLIISLIILLILFFIRKKTGKRIFCKISPGKIKVFSFISIGILPAMFMMDFGMLIGINHIPKMIWLFVFVYFITELCEYLVLKHETKII
jgi:hypothetical protein